MGAFANKVGQKTNSVSGNKPLIGPNNCTPQVYNSQPSNTENTSIVKREGHNNRSSIVPKKVLGALKKSAYVQASPILSATELIDMNSTGIAATSLASGG